MYGNEFVLPSLHLRTDSTRIEARVVSMTGSKGVDSVDVRVDENAPVEALVLTADRTSGWVPTAAKFCWTHGLPQDFTRVQVDVTDWGGLDVY